jgi:hypothetical protein
MLFAKKWLGYYDNTCTKCNVWNEVRLICTSSDLWIRNLSSSDTCLTISFYVDITSYSKIQYLHSGLTLLPHTAETDTHTHQLIYALHSLSICHIFLCIPPFAEVEALSVILRWFWYASRNVARSSEWQMHETKTG